MSADEPPLVVVELPGKGRGVLAGRAFAVGELVERAPVLVLAAEAWARIEPRLEGSGLEGYAFLWGPTSETAAIALGYGGLYNHSYRPNARYVKRPELQAIDFLAVRPIAPGEEITINYGGDPESTRPVWFDPL